MSNEPTKTQTVSEQESGKCHFTMLPALAMVSKQVRRESQRIFFEENKFEIALKLVNRHTLAPPSILHDMHRRVGLAITTLRVRCEIMKRCKGESFLFTASFTISKPGPELLVSDKAYNAERIRGHPHLLIYILNHFRVCGCRIKRLVHDHIFVGRDGVMQFLGNLRRVHLRSDKGEPCWDCKQKGLSCIPF